MKKYIFLITGLVVIDILVSLFVSSQLLGLQSDYTYLKQKEAELRAENTTLSQQVAHLSSLQRISRSAENLGLEKNNNRLVYIEKDIYAALR